MYTRDWKYLATWQATAKKEVQLATPVQASELVVTQLAVERVKQLLLLS
jgi:hypothetical protein